MNFYSAIQSLYPTLGTYFASSSTIRTPLEILKGNSPLGSDVVAEYCHYLASVNDQFSFLKELLYQALSVQEIASLIKKKKGPIHIPIILEKLHSLTYDHLVVFTLDCDNRTIEYYDPQGTPLDKQTRRVLGVNLPADQFIKELTAELDKEAWKVISNPTCHQYDFYRCGIFVCWYLEARQQKTTFQKIIDSKNVDPSRFREQMISQLKDFDSSTIDQPAKKTFMMFSDN